MNRQEDRSLLTEGQRWWREERLPEIEEIAYRELALYEQRFGTIPGDATPIEALVTELWGLRVVPLDLEASGYDTSPGTEAVFDHNWRIILLDINATEVQRRYTLAVEGGHWVLHRKNRPSTNEMRLFDDEDLYRPREPEWEHRESMYFAACVLMPRAKFIPLATQLLEDARLGDGRVLLSSVVETLAACFKVSKQSARIRLEEFNLIGPPEEGWFSSDLGNDGPLFGR